MNGREVEQEDAVSKKIYWSGTVILLGLLLLFLIVMLFSNNKLASQIRLLTEHPFTVNGDISDVKTDLALMRIRTERLQSYNQAADIKIVEAALNDLYTDIEGLISEIDALYLGPDEDIDELSDTYKAISEGQRHLLRFAALPDSTNDTIAEYEEEHLYPLYEKFEKSAERILTYVRNTQQSIFTSADHMSKLTVVWAFVIFFVMSIALLFFQSSVRKINLRLYQKNCQFEILSDTVDEAFLIFGTEEIECDFVSNRTGKVLGLSADRLRKDRTLIYQYMSKETAEEIHREIYSGMKESWDKVIEYYDPRSTEPHWLQVCFYRISSQTEIKYIMTLTDRTEEHRANLVLQDALVNAQNANNAKRDFLSHMSHEIRTPMNAIIGMTTIAAASTQTPRRVEDCLEKISYSSKHLLMLINDVLDMSRIESNRIKIRKEPFELYQFLNSFVSVIFPQASSKGLEFIEKTTDFTEHTTYLGDALRLNQILLNLVSNAVKFTPGGGKVNLEVKRLPSRGRKSWIRFVVSDTGIGMSKDALGRLYTPFEQADASIAQKYGGTGLGMPITQNLVSLMGGYIDVKSRPDEGTTFTVELPFEQSEVDLQPFHEKTLESLHALVADDEQDICEHTILLLNKMKINAEWVLSGNEAVELVISAQESGQGFDVCFIDWKMPDLDGVETTRLIREKVGWNTPIIIISAYDWTDIEEEARAAGADAFISKPLFQSSIYNVIVGVTNGAFGMAESNEKTMGDFLSGKRLLLAEDNALNMEIAVTLLEMNGAAVEGVVNGAEAVERFLQTEPGYFDAILMDVQMPVMDGCEAARCIRNCARADAISIPIIATTANAFAEDVSIVLAAGMNAHISKPLDMGQLCTMLSRLCDNTDD
ncbi:response regulator [Ruminococcus sp. OA3]|uniref:hybrid sensor histidine kinase/response regulator n=1 Tax=Ruminococcus sp. OA3 TaxID=2914164 RepID=UPI001F061571|nr:response regulator [Ruminococcus sp. OA3]MCH1981982.1 response regulator [Ruminococcus sp. OA3]